MLPKDFSNSLPPAAHSTTTQVNATTIQVRNYITGSILAYSSHALCSFQSNPKPLSTQCLSSLHAPRSTFIAASGVALAVKMMVGFRLYETPPLLHLYVIAHIRKIHMLLLH